MATSTSKPAGNAPKKEAPKEGPPKPAAAPASGDRRMMAMIAAFAILSAGASAGAVYMVTRNQLQAGPGAHGAVATREFPGPTYNLGDFIVNLGGAETRRYLKATVALACNTHSDDFARLSHEKMGEFMNEFNAEMKMREPQIKDIVNSTIASYTARELGTVQGRQQLKTTLVNKLARLLPPEYELANVYFTDFIIQ
jgi:flagellar basal body-associated protein FliL